MNDMISITLNQPLTMSSQEIAKLTDKRHDNVLRDIRAMLVSLYGEEHVEKRIPEQYRNRHSEYIRENSVDIFDKVLAHFGDSSNGRNEQNQGFSWTRDERGFISEIHLDHNHTLTLIAGYNVKLRKAIIDRWQQLEAQQAPALPKTYVEALRELLSAVEAREQAEERARIAESTKAQIGSRREATAMATASAAVQKMKRLELELDKSPEYATIKRMNEIHDGMLLVLSATRVKSLSVLGKRLKAESILLKIPFHTVIDKEHETVFAYHRKVWLKVCGLDILRP